MITQHYKLPYRAEDHFDAKSGCFVLDQNDEFVIGFIDYVSDTSFVVMLFEPMDLDLPHMENISESCDPQARLREIFDEDGEIEEVWRLAMEYWRTEQLDPNNLTVTVN